MNYYNWIIPIFLIVLIGGFYLGKKASLFIKLNTTLKKIIFWIIIYMIMLISILLRFAFMGFIIYFLSLSFIYDVIFFLFKKLKKIKITRFLEKIYKKGIPFIFISIIITIYGVYNINHPIVKNYNIKINQTLKNNLTIGMISDLHLGTIHNEEILNQIVEHANKLNVDIFLLVGDIFDEYTSEDLKESCYEILSKINTKHGIFYVEGNHDILTSSTEFGYNSHNIKVLNDKALLIDNSFYLVGRRDLRNNKTDNKRKQLSDLLKDLDQTKPIILTDHQPVEEDIAEKLGVDLQLSGHTHGGQLFPANFLLKYGYRKNKDYQIVVSSGYGGWGFALRTTGRSEMLKINLTNS